MSRIPYLIVGNSAAAIGAVEGIRSVDGERPITIHKRNRLRLTGTLQIRFYRQSLREVLVRSGNAALVGKLDSVYDPDQIYAIHDSVSLHVNNAVVLASMGRRQAKRKQKN